MGGCEVDVEGFVAVDNVDGGGVEMTGPERFGTIGGPGAGAVVVEGREVEAAW
jgi:hypothetical protein